ncbi:MAG TPA: hypothetical protein VGE31_03090 [Candidatus Paceibacterota bacterium]
MYTTVSKDRQLQVAAELLPLLKSIIPVDVLEYWVEHPQAVRTILQDMLYAERHRPTEQT